MWVLGIETSGLAGSVALWRSDQSEPPQERSLATAGRRHAQTLVAEIAELTRAAAIRPAEIGLVTVSRGPGSFTGLRVGITCAKTAAYTIGCPVKAVDTFAVLATQIGGQHPGREIVVLDDAQRGEICWGRYVLSGDAWQLQDRLIIESRDRLASVFAGPTILVGPGTRKLTEPTAEWRLIDEPPSAGWVCRLGHGAWQKAGSDDMWQLTPHYIRPSAAEEKRAKAQAEKAALSE